MKALTICQPYPFLILASADELPPDVEQKRVENRTWEMLYRGPLLIHAGKSKKYLKGWDTTKFPPLDFGAIVGMVTVLDCFSFGQITEHTLHPRIAKNFPWLPKHQHTEGPFCIVMAHPRRFAKPIPYTGRLGLFDVPMDVVKDQV